MTKPKEIVRAEQLLALAAYNSEVQEARSAAMALVNHIVSKGIVFVMDGYKQERPARSKVHYQPPPPPPAPSTPQPAPRPRRTRYTPPAAQEPEQPKRRPPRRKAKPEPAPQPPIGKRDEPNPDQMDLFPRTFVAVAGGTCIHCRRPFVAGDHISWMAGAGATHDVCSDKYNWPRVP